MNRLRLRHIENRCSSRGRDNGFTLFELILVIAILPLVIGAISVALLSVFSNANTTTSSLTASSDQQVTSASFGQDVQSANWVTTDSADLLECTGQSGTLLLSLSPDNLASGSIKNIISYVEVANADTPVTYTVYREACSGGKGSAATNTVAVAHKALPSATVLSFTPSTVITSGGWVSGDQFQNIQLVLAEPQTTHDSTSAYSYSMSAVPRTSGTGGATPTGNQGSTSGGSFTPVVPVTILSNSCPALTLTGSGSLVNSQDGSGSSGSGTAAFGASQSSCPNPTSGTGTLNATIPYTYGASDPFAKLPPPSFPSTNGLENGSCTASTCKAGIYGNATTGGYHGGSISSGVTFDPSLGSPTTDVVVFTQPVTIQNATVTFDGGTALTNTQPPNPGVVYWFEQGLSISTGSNVTFGPATYIFGTTQGTGNVLSISSQSTISAPNGSTGLIFYIPPSTVNNAQTASMASGVSGSILGASSPYDNIAIWDASNGTLSMGQGNGGGSGITASFGGIYVPNGSLSIAGNYQLNAQFMVANNATIQTSQVTMTG